MALTGARQPYLHALLEITAAPRAMPVPAPLFLVEGQLARRVASLMKEVRMSKLRLVASLVIVVAMLVATGWWAVKTFWLTAPLGTPRTSSDWAARSRPTPSCCTSVNSVGRGGFSMPPQHRPPDQGAGAHLYPCASLHAAGEEG